MKLRGTRSVVSVCAAAIVTAAAMFAIAGDAGAFPEATLVCAPIPLGAQEVRYGFVGSEWDPPGSADYRPFARASLEEWETAFRDSDGSIVATITEGFVGAWVALVPDTTPNGLDTNRGFADCTPANPPDPDGAGPLPAAAVVIEVNPNQFADLAAMMDVVQHEMGHVLGLHHTGDEDNLIGLNPPIMATCDDVGTPFGSVRALGNDDGSSLRHKRGAGGVLSNDGSFESASSIGGSGSTQGWTATNGTLTRSTSSPYALGGPQHARYTPAGSLNLLWQANNRAIPGPSKARVAFRKLSGAASGNLTLIFEKRVVGYSADGCEGKYQIPYNQNERTFVGSVYFKYRPDLVVTPTTTWQIVANPDPGVLHEMGDWRVGIASSVTSGGTYATVAIDLLQGFSA